MNKRQRFESLITEGRSIDKVIFRPILMQFAAEYIGSNYGKFASDYKTLVEANLVCMEDFNTDMIGVISDPYRETSAFGAKIEFVKDGVPRCLNTLINSIEDIRLLKNPEVRSSERTLDRILAVESMSKKTQGTVPIIGWVEGPLAEACDLAGVQHMMVQLMIDPDFCNLLMDKCLQTAKDFALAQIQAGCDIIGIGDAVCSQIDGQTYDTYVRPRHHELIAYIHEQNARVKLHICGDTHHLLPYYRGLNVDILDLDYQVDIQHARAILGSELILCGNINPTDLISASPEELKTNCDRLVESHRKERYILSAGCEISALTPASNLNIMSQSAYWN